MKSSSSEKASPAAAMVTEQIGEHLRHFTMPPRDVPGVEVHDLSGLGPLERADAWALLDKELRVGDRARQASPNVYVVVRGQR